MKKSGLICPKCKKGLLQRRQYDLFDCNNFNCEQLYSIINDRITMLTPSGGVIKTIDKSKIEIKRNVKKNSKQIEEQM